MVRLLRPPNIHQTGLGRVLAQEAVARVVGGQEAWEREAWEREAWEREVVAREAWEEEA